jgi:hypothetical protein
MVDAEQLAAMLQPMYKELQVCVDRGSTWAHACSLGSVLLDEVGCVGDGDQRDTHSYMGG